MKDIIQYLSTKFSYMFFTLVQRDDDGFEFNVCCYGVEKTARRNVRDAIYDYNENHYPDFSVCYTPILFSSEETKECCPEAYKMIKVPFDVWGECDYSNISLLVTAMEDVDSNRIKDFRVADKGCCNRDLGTIPLIENHSSAYYSSGSRQQETEIDYSIAA